MAATFREEGTEPGVQVDSSVVLLLVGGPCSLSCWYCSASLV